MSESESHLINFVFKNKRTWNQGKDYSRNLLWNNFHTNSNNGDKIINNVGCRYIRQY